MEIVLRLFSPFTDMEIASASTVTPSTLAGLHILNVTYMSSSFHLCEYVCVYMRRGRGVSHVKHTVRRIHRFIITVNILCIYLSNRSHGRFIA